MSDELLKNEGDEGAEDVEAHTQVRAQVRAASDDDSEDVEANRVRAQVRAASDDDSDDVEAHQVRAQVRAVTDDDSDDVEARHVRAWACLLFLFVCDEARAAPGLRRFQRSFSSSVSSRSAISGDNSSSSRRCSSFAATRATTARSPCPASDDSARLARSSKSSAIAA